MAEGMIVHKVKPLLPLIAVIMIGVFSLSVCANLLSSRLSANDTIVTLEAYFNMACVIPEYVFIFRGIFTDGLWIIVLKRVWEPVVLVVAQPLGKYSLSVLKSFCFDGDGCDVRI